MTREGCNVVLCDLEGAPNHLRLNETKFYYDSLRSQPEIWVFVVKIGDQYMSIPSPFTQAQTENQFTPWQPLSFSCFTRRREKGKKKAMKKNSNKQDGKFFLFHTSFLLSMRNFSRRICSLIDGSSHFILTSLMGMF